MRENHPRWARYVALVSFIWVVVMGVRLYPHFGDTLRLDGRAMSFEEYVEESCGQRIGPAAISCLAEARDTGRRLVAQQQAKSLLLVEAPLWLLLAIYLPGLAARRRAAT
ncbi:MAG TPA: hypothetical protein VGU20_28835 [Stellaceae bacterium]|nr:hypothetical protein [Stellaceae bacterium]